VKSSHIDELEHQSELTRRQLDRTLADLQLHLSPRYQLHRAWNATRDLSTRTLHRGERWAGAHPMALLSLGVTLLGVWYLMARWRKSDRR
jgi:hypothetical protein